MTQKNLSEFIWNVDSKVYKVKYFKNVKVIHL